MSNPNNRDAEGFVRDLNVLCRKYGLYVSHMGLPLTLQDVDSLDILGEVAELEDSTEDDIVYRLKALPSYKVQVEDRYNSNPDFAPVGHIGYSASWEHPFPEGVRGCPLGRGKTKSAAVSDLLRRTNQDSRGVHFHREQVDVNDKSTG